MGVLPFLLLNFQKIFYEKALTSQARGVADDIAEVLTAEARNRLISVEGHTDAVGSDTYNQELSKRRVENVAQALEHAGVSSQRITAQGYGERYPVAPNTYPDGRDNLAGRAQNRRVEVAIQNS